MHSTMLRSPVLLVTVVLFLVGGSCGSKTAKSCLLCLKQLSSTTNFCKAKEKDGLQIVSLTYYSKRKYVIDIHENKAEGESQKRLMRMTLGGSKIKKADCLCSRLFKKDFVNSPKVDIQLKISVPKRVTNGGKVVGKILRNSVLAACPDQIRRIRKFYERELKNYLATASKTGHAQGMARTGEAPRLQIPVSNQNKKTDSERTKLADVSQEIP
eukprot:m.6220 g.6220  ORF g.6220 m.6220 type:complete len:213 (+) comp15306_c0_seq1:219-857(+)